jgi:hypothetical protein
MRRLLLVPFLLHALITTAQQPGDFLKPDLWLRADQFGKDSSIWEDKSHNKFDAIPNQGFILKTDSLINFNRAITFDGDSNRFTIPLNLSETTQLTILTVYDSNGTQDERAIWGATINPQQDVMLSTQRVTSPTSIAKYSEGNMNAPVINASSQYWGKKGDIMPDASFFLGNSVANEMNPFSGEIAEFLVFDRLLGGIELQMFQSYLSLKYGATLQYSDYISSKGNVVWNFTDNEEYSFSIAGVGRDNGFDLYQKQSSNVEEPGVLTLGINGIEFSNEANLSIINNGNFLVWGMNEFEPIMELSEDEIYPYAMPVLERKWKMQVTGNEAKTIPTELQFNVKDIIGESKTCYLVIDRSGNGQFSSDEVEYISAENINEDGIATFQHILWDEDKSGSDVFSLSFGMDNGVTCTHPICHNDATGSIHLQIMGGAAPYSFNITSDSLNYKQEWNGESRFQDVNNLQPGNYRVLVTDKNNNIAQNTVTINNPDEFSIGLEQENTLTMGESIKLDAGKYVSKREASFEWRSDNGFYSTDDEVLLTQPGEYILKITNKMGCVVTETLTVNAFEDKFYNYKVYPNPSTGDYKLEIALAEESPVLVKVYNTQGALLSEESATGASNYVFRNYINKVGIYFIVIETGYGKETFKLIINP